MDKTFTYIGDLSTPLDYARWRIDDIDPQATQDETQSPSPFLWDDTYLALFSRHGVHQGMIVAVRVIAAKMAKDITTFSEANGVRVAWKDREYFQRLAEEIAQEPPYDASEIKGGSGITTGHLTRGVDDSKQYRRTINRPPAFPLGRKKQ